MAKARYIMVGGFLGAGKTTAVLALATHLRDLGARAGLITNDQSFGLVDTAMLSSNGFDVEEIGGGCFCCRFNTLVEASEKLSQTSRPDAFIAEPVMGAGGGATQGSVARHGGTAGALHFIVRSP